MIALDLDNTLLDNHKKISEANVAALQRLHQQGLKIVLCTGRPLAAIHPYIAQLGLTAETDYTITFNGGLVVHNATGEVLYQNGLHKTDFEPLYQYASRYSLPLDILDFDQDFQIKELGPSLYHRAKKVGVDYFPVTFKELPDNLFSTALVSIKPTMLDAVNQQLPEALFSTYHVVRSQPHMLEFLSPEVDKIVGIKALLARFNWDTSNLMTFGDAENDFHMIQQAGEGVAMINGQLDVKAVADHITTKDNNESGVADYLQRYFELV
ncbi:Cof-type HAD-IIB family hydrolase [Levilactobacillus yonginensis]|uniref:Cof-type HAD-IIB family hydrolase n=1 Tax=Levilactobacillus yonginensis TaxID=1054041 RepID=UPI001CDC98A9|nr:Cof-type HAD-IIB family hydrolase [Levilactobacillus yonginensis]